MSHIIIKTAKNHKNTILWQALYINSNKVLENYVLDVNKALKAFNINSSVIVNLIVHENNKIRIPLLFPDFDEFEQLDENEEYELNEGDSVWVTNYSNHNYIIKAGKVTVKEIFNTPLSDILWDIEYIKKTVTWFSCNEAPGLFCWTKLVKLQDALKKKSGDSPITISNRSNQQKK